MESQNVHKCPECDSVDTGMLALYNTVHNGDRRLLVCKICKTRFSETKKTVMENIKTPISKVASALKLRSEGIGLRATGRILNSHKNTISEWETRFAGLTETLMLYAFCHEFVSLTFEGDELYTIVGKRGRPTRTLPKGVRVRIKNKGSQNHKKGRKRPKYHAPQREHPDTDQNLSNPDIHANHLEAHNASIRRRNSPFRRRTNMYAKTKEGLQRTLDVHLIIHNFIRPHWTTGLVPPVSLGILKCAKTLEEVLSMQSVA
jgi:transposase-like protein